ncbi:MAG TPA: hypothetical protein VM327_03735 [Candidatus Thermoplasmatota archaeon]|nr:hypothetical protein [Candidatus Thermoplasmatota archaeon]
MVAFGLLGIAVVFADAFIIGWVTGYAAAAGGLALLPFSFVLAGRTRPRLQALALATCSAPLAYLCWFVSLEWDFTATDLALAYGWCGAVFLAGVASALRPSLRWPLLAIALASGPAAWVLGAVTSWHPFVLAAALAECACALHAWRVVPAGHPER